MLFRAVDPRCPHPYVQSSNNCLKRWRWSAEGKSRIQNVESLRISHGESGCVDVCALAVLGTRQNNTGERVPLAWMQKLDVICLLSFPTRRGQPWFATCRTWPNHAESTCGSVRRNAATSLVTAS